MYLFFLQDYFLEIKKQNLEDFDTWSILQKKKKKNFDTCSRWKYIIGPWRIEVPFS